LPLRQQTQPTNALKWGAAAPHFRGAARRSSPLLWAAALVLLLADPIPTAAQSLPAARTATVATEAQPAASVAAQAAEEAQSPRAREAAYTRRLDAAIAPLRNYQVSKDDAAKIRDAIQALAADQLDKAAALKTGISDPLGRKLVDWYRLRRGHGAAAEFATFLAENPRWPSEEILRRRMEEVLFAEGGDSAAIAKYFNGAEPQSAAGFAVLASVHLAHGETDKAKALASKVWREYDLPPDLEHGFLARFGSLLTQEDHKWRLDRLLVDDVRWKSGRDERAAQARRVIPLLPQPEQKQAEARLQVFLHARVDKSRLKATPGAGATDWGLAFHKIQQLRRAEKLDEAAKLILSAPIDPDVVVNLDDWWSERQGLAYLALKANKAKLAYQLVSDVGPLSVNPLNEQSFMAGWIALRYLKDVDAAERHFTAFTKTADGPLSRAKAFYWLGRAEEAKGDKEKAKEAYRAAALQSDTFHGLLAMQKLEPGRRRITIEPPQSPSPEEISELNGMDAAKAVGLAYAAGLNRPVTRIFLRHLATLKSSEGWSAMVAHLAHAMDDTQTAVRIGKAAIADGHNLVYYAYPVHALPDYKPLRPPPETAFLLGLARQETEFDTDIVSGAGARGILQVMKGTASHVCHEYKIKCNHQQLVADASYNTMIASAYVADRMAEFSGSYVLGLSSYNAGPGRTRQWIREFGDPRMAGVDPIDWIERIPIEETRRYVAKVLSNIQIYRARLGDEATALRLDQDLSRAREAALSPGMRQSKPGTNTAKSGD
jgi:soluble lytic murein transglycosylase